MLDRKVAPVVVIGFKRADLLQKCFFRLSRCRSLGERPVRVYIDGPRNEAERAAVDQSLMVAKRFKASVGDVEIIRRERNFGCRGNITAAISETLKQFGRAIIVEEDVCVSPSFLEYMDMALDSFKEDKRIWCVNAHVNPWMRIPRAYGKDLFLTRRNAAWGWGTWFDRWSEVDFDMLDWKALCQDAGFISKMNFVGCDLREIADLQVEGKVDTWDVQCTVHMIKNGLYAVSPRYSISKNIGFGEGGLHCNSYDAIYAKQKYYDFLPNVSESLAADNGILRQERYAGVIRAWMLLRRLRRKVHTLLPTSSNEEPFVIPS